MKRITLMFPVLILAMLWMACEQTTTVPTQPAQSQSLAKTSLLSPEAKVRIDAQLKDWKTKMPEVLAKLKVQLKESPQQRQARVTSAVRAKAAEFKTRFQAQAQKLSKEQGVQIAAANQIYVPDDYATIQEAVDAAVPGDEIIVRDGEYDESAIVEKDNITLKAENGFESVVLYGVVAFVGVTGGTVDGFICIGNGGGITESGTIFIVQSADVTVKNNGVAWSIGLIIFESINCIVKDNVVWYTTPIGAIFVAGGISAVAGSGHLISGNYAAQNGVSGIFVLGTGINVKNNVCVENGGAEGWDPINYSGILDVSFIPGTGGNNHYMNNEATGNLFGGMVLLGSDNNKIGPTNTLNGNGVVGLALLWDSDYNVVQKNTAHDNGDVDMANEGVGNTFIKNDFGTTFP